MKNQSAFLISILAIGLSIVVIILFFVRVSPNSVVDLGTFIGVCAAFIGIAVTLLIGYQIYNAVEIKNKLSEISDIKKQLLSLKNGTEVLRNETYEAINILQSRDPNLKGIYSPNVLLYFMSALPHSLSLFHKKDGFGLLLDELESDMLNILLPSFGSGTRDVFVNGVKTLKELMKESDNLIRNHENYYLIKERYECLMSKFEKRLEIISRAENPSLYILDVKSGEEPEYKN